MIHMREYNPFEKRNVQFLVNKRIDYTTIQITQTGINKSTLDATAPVRSFFKEYGIHDYEHQLQGPDNKIFKETYILTETDFFKTQTALYRPVTKKVIHACGYMDLLNMRIQMTSLPYWLIRESYTS